MSLKPPGPTATVAVGIWLLAGVVCAVADEVRAAVAANFTGAANEIAEAFAAATGHEVVLSFGSTGQLFAQITHAAPFDVFLAADAARPERLVADGFAVVESRFTYAVGKLVLWSADPGLVTGEATLASGQFDKLAIADPAAAPYGAAAVAVIEALGLTELLMPRLVTGASIAQTFQFIETGNAELGFIALSQIVGTNAGSRWVVPQSLCPAIRQDAVLLSHAAGNEAAIAFLSFLAGDEARHIIESHGYATGGAE